MKSINKLWKCALVLAIVAFLSPAFLIADDAPATQAATAPAPKVRIPPPDPTIPVPRDPKWLERHDGFVAQAKKGGIDVLFMGDSITDHWRGIGKAIWNECYAPLHAANFGISADQTQHVLWRLDNGETVGITPKVVVLMIGTNNIGDTPTNITRGVTAVVNDIRTKLPDSKILLLAIFPRDAKPGTPRRKKIIQVNEQLAQLDDGKMIKYLDIGKAFLDDDGNISTDIMADALHPTPMGYYLWAQAMNPTLQTMLGTPIPEPKKPPIDATLP